MPLPSTHRPQGQKDAADAIRRAEREVGGEDAAALATLAVAQATLAVAEALDSIDNRLAAIEREAPRIRGAIGMGR